MPYLSAGEREIAHIVAFAAPVSAMMFGEGEDDEYGDDDLTL